MWGHQEICVCPICASLRRCFEILILGTPLPGFGAIAAPQVRHLEGELRDILSFSQAQGRNLSSNLPAGPPPAAEGQSAGAAPSGQAEASGAPTGGPAPASQPEQEKKEPQKDIHTTPKCKSSEPPLPPRGVALKVEPQDSPSHLVDVEDLEKAAPASLHSKPKRKDNSHKRRRSASRHRDRSPRRSRSRKGRRGRRESRSPSEKGGKEKKESPRQVPAPATPPRPPPRRPRSPSRPPPGFREARGRGWQGEVPYSSHPRWGGQNKGVVKLAEQEIYSRRHYK